VARRNGSTPNTASAEPATADVEHDDALDGDVVRLERAAVQRLRVNQATIDRSAVGFAKMERATLQQSTAGVVVARSLACDEVRTAVLVAPVVRGEVHALFDLRTAVAIGFGMALGRGLLAVFRALGRRLKA
jgi:hypothetical protein